MKNYLFILLIFNNMETIEQKIRIAQRNEIDWINKKYDEVKFPHSNYDNEIIAIAEINNIKCGLGRLIKIENNVFELGGMYVFEEYRNNKIATHIIEFLLKQINQKAIIYCLPFKELTFFYKRFGFSENVNLKNVPSKVQKKYDWCNIQFKQGMNILVKQPNYRKS